MSDNGQEQLCEDGVCVICGTRVIGKEAERRMRFDGLQTLLNSSAQRGDNLHVRLEGVDLKDIKYHDECRRRYNDKRRISEVECASDPVDRPKKRTLRSELPDFNWGINCFCVVARLLKILGILSETRYIKSGQLI